ncbi:MAG TPA: sulfotransferase [Novosphingobium sp.]|nr:sulfotransferase [Novosphingobium sp.]
MAEMSAEQLLAAATASTELEDFGADGFREGLDQAVIALGKLPLTPQAKEGAIAKIVTDLSNRLRIEAWYKEHPEIEDGKIEGPLLVFGLPRTGTSATVAMLALDDRYRYPRRWEGQSQVPPPVLGEEDGDPRVIQARADAVAFNAKNLNWHLYDADGPDEDQLVFGGLNMRNLYGMYPISDEYLQWWMEDDYRSTFAYHERVLKLLQSRRPPYHWLLKSPSHLFKLDALIERYPDTKIVMTHRDPAKIIASMASVFQMTYDSSCGAGTIDKRWTGRRALTMWVEGIRRGMASRDRLGEDRFVDVYNADVVKDPVGTFEKLYDDLGFDMDSRLRGKLDEFHRQNAKGAHGSHDYTPEEYGLDEKKVRAEFKEYIDRFGL